MARQDTVRRVMAVMERKVVYWRVASGRVEAVKVRSVLLRKDKFRIGGHGVERRVSSLLVQVRSCMAVGSRFGTAGWVMEWCGGRVEVG